MSLYTACDPVLADLNRYEAAEAQREMRYQRAEQNVRGDLNYDNDTFADFLFTAFEGDAAHAALLRELAYGGNTLDAALRLKALLLSRTDAYVQSEAERRVQRGEWE